LTTFINSFEYNTTLLKIIWRLTSRQSFKINACITRNNEIGTPAISHFSLSLSLLLTHVQYR